jgi:hypothetical protein
MSNVVEGTRLSIEDVESAINRYRRVHESTGDECTMDHSLSQMAHVYGQMIWDRSDGVDVQKLDKDVRQLFLEWRGP